MPVLTYVELDDLEGQCVSRASLRFASGPSSAFLCDAMLRVHGWVEQEKGKMLRRLFVFLTSATVASTALAASVDDDTCGGIQEGRRERLQRSCRSLIKPPSSFTPPRCRRPPRHSSESACLQTHTVALVSNCLMMLLPLADVHNMMCTVGKYQRH